MKEAEAQGRGKDRKDCMRQFRAAWDKFSADPSRLVDFCDQTEATLIRVGLETLIRLAIPAERRTCS